MTTSLAVGTALEAERQAYPIRFPENELEYDQDEEWCEVYLQGRWHRIRLHDYAEIYRVEGLYEHLFTSVLRCCSPKMVVGLFAEVLRDWPQAPTELSVLDLGAGNGMVGEELRRLGVRSLVGADIIPEAAEAARRDRPGLYDAYVVADMCRLSAADAQRLLARRPNTLVTVAALGFADIPPRAFATAFNLISTPGWLAFNIKETFINGGDQSGFCRLLRDMAEHGIIQTQAYRRYNHRFSIAGKPLSYVAVVARKLRDVPRSLVDDVR